MSPSDLSIYDTRIFVPSSQISMAKSPLRPSPARPLRVAGFWPGLLLLCLLAPVALAKSSLRPITDIEVREKKQACYADIESGLWGSRCRWSIIDKENCALRCLSPVCFQLIYESDPLEEGENDFVRGQEFKYCMRKVSLGESLDGIRGAFDYI